MKFPLGNQVGNVLGDRLVSRRCYVEEIRKDQRFVKTRVREGSCSGKSREMCFAVDSVSLKEAKSDLQEVQLGPPVGVVRVSRELPEDLKSALIGFFIQIKQPG